MEKISKRKQRLQKSLTGLFCSFALVCGGVSQAKSFSMYDTASDDRIRVANADAAAAPTRNNSLPDYMPPRRSYIVAEASSGAILDSEGADALRYPASLTKVMTLYLLFEALENGDVHLETQMPISQRAAGMPAFRLGLEAGDYLTVRDAIMSLIVTSSNDTAVVVAEYLGGSEVAFARMMTAKARELGMSRTQYRNASGWHHPEQATTARDQMTLMRAMQNNFQGYYELFQHRHYLYNGDFRHGHNRILVAHENQDLPFRVDGMKTGYVRASGFNLMASATRYDTRFGREIRVNAVYFGGRSPMLRDRAVLNLLEENFASASIAFVTPRLSPQRQAVRDNPPPTEAENISSPAVRGVGLRYDCSFDIGTPYYTQTRLQRVHYRFHDENLRSALCMH